MNNTSECPQKIYNFLNIKPDLIPLREYYREKPFIDDIVIHIFGFLNVENRTSGDLASTCYQFYKVSKMMQMEVNHSLNQACSHIIKGILDISYDKKHPSLLGNPLGESLTFERAFYYNFDSLYSSLKVLNPYKPNRIAFSFRTNLDQKSFVLIEKMIHEEHETYIVERSGVISLHEGHFLKKELQLVAKQVIAAVNEIRGI